MHYLFFDCETTGLDSKKHTLLTAYFAIYDKDLNLIEDLDLQLKPEDTSNIVCTKEAMEVTGIDLQEHLNDVKTITYEEGKKLLLSMLDRNKIKKKRKHYIPSGHNILFDLGFIWEQFIPKDEWEKTIHYGKKIDTYIICSFLQAIDLLPSDLGKLTGLVDYFKLPMGQAHNAREDIKMNVEVFKEMISMFRKNSNMNGVSSSLLEIIEQ